MLVSCTKSHCSMSCVSCAACRISCKCSLTGNMQTPQHCSCWWLASDDHPSHWILMNGGFSAPYGSNAVRSLMNVHHHGCLSSYSRFTPNRDQLGTDLRVEKFWISWTCDLLKHHNRLASSWPLHAIRKSTGIKSAPEPQPWPVRRDTLATDLWLTHDALRPISDRPLTRAWPPRVTCVCMRQKFQEWLVTDLRPCWMTYKAIEWITTNLQRLPTKGGSICELGLCLTSSKTIFDV